MPNLLLIKAFSLEIFSFDWIINPFMLRSGRQLMYLSCTETKVESTCTFRSSQNNAADVTGK